MSDDDGRDLLPLIYAGRGATCLPWYAVRAVPCRAASRAAPGGTCLMVHYIQIHAAVHFYRTLVQVHASTWYLFAAVEGTWVLFYLSLFYSWYGTW